MKQNCYYLIVNLNKENALQCASDAAHALAKMGQTVLVEEQVAPLLKGCPVMAMPHQQALQACQIVIAIGGDGTMIHAAIEACIADRPIVGINSGRLGFLTQIEHPFTGELEALVHGEYTIQQRTVLRADIHTSEVVTSAYAFNDVVVFRGDTGTMIDMQVQRQGRHFATYRADGLIFATATGSTAYSLSAGGAIVEPTVDCLLMTPICPHSLQDRGVILDAQEALTLHLVKQNTSPSATVAIDGTILAHLHEGDELTIAKAARYVQFIQLHTSDFYKTVGMKFRSDI